MWKAAVLSRSACERPVVRQPVKVGLPSYPTSINPSPPTDHTPASTHLHHIVRRCHRPPPNATPTATASAAAALCTGPRPRAQAVQSLHVPPQNPTPDQHQPLLKRRLRRKKRRRNNIKARRPRHRVCQLISFAVHEYGVEASRDGAHPGHEGSFQGREKNEDEGGVGAEAVQEVADAAEEEGSQVGRGWGTGGVGVGAGGVVCTRCFSSSCCCCFW